MGKMVEIRWHARGGQGAKTASMLLAEAAAAAGRYVQGFPEYGPERMGAPVLAFNRISDAPIRIHASVTAPDVVMVLDPTLIGKAEVAEGLNGDGIIIVNTTKSPAEMRTKLRLDGNRVFTLDANQISLDTIGRPIPNTPMMGALLKAKAVMDFEEFLDSARHELEKKFKGKSGVIEGNLKAITRAYEEVQAE